MILTKSIFYVIISLSLIPVFLLFVANPILIENSIVLLDATSSGGHASSQGVSSSTKSGSSSSSSSGGGYSLLKIEISITIPSVDASFNDVGVIQLDWGTRDSLTVLDVENLSVKDFVQFDNFPITIKSDKNEFFINGFSSGKFTYIIKDIIPYGVHQIPLIVTVSDGYNDYEAQTLLTIDNTGFFFILENFRGIFGITSSNFISI